MYTLLVARDGAVKTFSNSQFSSSQISCKDSFSISAASNLGNRKVLLGCSYTKLLISAFVFTQLAKKIREKFNRYLDVVNRNKQVVEASYTAHLTSPLTAIQDCCFIPASMME